MKKLVTVLFGILSFLLTVFLSIVIVFISLGLVTDLSYMSGIGAAIIMYIGGGLGIFGYIICSIILYVRTKRSRKSFLLTIIIVPVMVSTAFLIYLLCNLSKF